MFETLKTICELPGPGGDEQLVQSWLRNCWTKKVESLQDDRVGNLIAHVGGKGPRLVLAAHADEICFVVKSISEDGFLWLTSGQRDAEQRPSLRSFVFIPWGQPALVVTENGQVDGYFATITGHILTPEQREKHKFEWSDIFVEIGCISRAEVEKKGVQIGDRVLWNPPTRRLGNLVYGKAMDDRAGLTVLDRLLDIIDRDLLGYDLTLASTVQEEIGLVGAEALASRNEFDIGISVDGGVVGDVPGVDRRDLTASLGKGPIIVHKDLHNYNRKLTLQLIKTARQADIPVQPAVFSICGYDSGAFNRKGFQSGVVAIPTRFTHSPFETIHLQDMEFTAQLLKKFLEKPA